MNTSMPPFEDPNDRRLHAALRRMPELRAPDNLVSNVLGAIRARDERVAISVSGPWYRRPATSWPPAMRIALGIASLILVGAAAIAPQILWSSPEVGAIQATLTRAWDTVVALVIALRTLIEAAMIALRGTTSPHILIGGAAVMLFSYFALLGIGGAVWRTASSQARRS